MDQDSVHAGKEKRKMPIKDQNKIRQNWCYLKSNLRDHVDYIKDSLFEKFVIDREDKEKVETIKKEDKNAAIEVLLNKLTCYGSLEKFIDCLKEKGFVDVVKKICEGENEEVMVKTGNEREIRVVVIGKTGAGKSALGNSLLNLEEGEAFISKSSPSSVTKINLLKERVVRTEDGNISLKVLDTPGLSDTRKNNTETAKELVKCMVDLNPGPHIFIFALKLDRIGEDILNNIQFLKDTFGSCLKTYGIIVFTGKDTIDVEFNIWLKSASEEFKHFLSHYCNGRYALINNREKDHQIKEQQVRDIIKLVLDTIQFNKNDYYRNEMYEEAKKVYEEKLKRAEEEKTKIERELKEHLKSVENENVTLKEHLEQQKRATDDLQQKNQQLKQLTTELDRIKNESEETRKKYELLTKENDELKRIGNIYNYDNVNVAGRYGFIAGEQYQDASIETVQNTQRYTNSNLKRKIVDRLTPEEVPTRKRKQSGNKFSKQLRDQNLANTESSQQPDDTQQTSENQIEMAVPPKSADIDTVTEDITNEKVDMDLYKVYTSLHSPCRYGTLENVKHLIDIGADVNATERRNMTPLVYCSQSLIDPVAKIQLLMSHKANIYHRDVNDDSILHHACKSGKLETVKYLIHEIGMDVNSTNLKHETPLFFCCRSQIEAKEKIKLLVENGGNKDTMDIYNNKIIHVACKNGELEIVKYLIDELNINVNTRGFENQTPLMNCIWSSICPLDKIKLLVENEANIDTMDINNDKIIHVACKNGELEIVKYLIDELNINVNTRGFKNLTPLMNCILSSICPLDKIKFLISRKAAVDCVDDTHSSNALHLACSFGTVEVVDYLKDIIDVNSKSYRDRTPIFYCFESITEPVAKIKSLVSRGAEFNVVDSLNVTAFEQACLCGTYETVQYMIQMSFETNTNDRMLTSSSVFFCSESSIKPVDKIKLLQSMNVNIKDRDINNESILHSACKLGISETVEYLLDFFPEFNDEEYKLLIEFCKRSKFNSEEKVRLLTQNYQG
ncbi:uncharacterized protein LOC126821692 [Patella vulgata]|uniref:uncharacterized protein LOC126821692 n=1 Tax=Patella vulgata TaxID=6465 RepID=UPI00218091E0|nr:uncharacterized protein LOC126821692 [Patella vulgata]